MAFVKDAEKNGKREMGIIEILEKFGLPIAFLAVMIWLYRNDKKDHKEERETWRGDVKGMSERQNKLQEDTNKVLRELTSAISNKDKD
jgi:hypothetical protein